MTVLRLENFSKPERLNTQAQTKLTPSEYKELERIRDTLNRDGIGGVTISSLIRTFVLYGVRAFQAEEKASD